MTCDIYAAQNISPPLQIRNKKIQPLNHPSKSKPRGLLHRNCPKIQSETKQKWYVNTPYFYVPSNYKLTQSVLWHKFANVKFIRSSVCKPLKKGLWKMLALALIFGILQYLGNNNKLHKMTTKKNCIITSKRVSLTFHHGPFFQNRKQSKRKSHITYCHIDYMLIE